MNSTYATRHGSQRGHKIRASPVLRDPLVSVDSRRDHGCHPHPAQRGSPGQQKKKDRTHWLYISVIIAVGLGIAVGLVFPEVGKALKPLGTGFVNLIKMMIAPVIFCTIVLGIGSVRKASQVGKVGGIALAYFLTMSTLALTVGLWSATSSTPVRDF